MLRDAPGIDAVMPARLWFEIRYLHLLGLFPSFDYCASCGGTLGQSVKFSLKKPGWICERCGDQASASINIEPGVMAVISYILRNNLDQVMKLKLSRRQSDLLDRLLSYLIDSAAHKKIKSKRFLNQVLSQGN